MGYYSVIRKDKFESFIEKWMHPETIILSKIDQTQKVDYYTISSFMRYQSINHLKTKIKEIIGNKVADDLMGGGSGDGGSWGEGNKKD